MCEYVIVLPNFSHRMHVCTWIAADKPFIKRRCYVVILVVIVVAVAVVVVVCRRGRSDSRHVSCSVVLL